MIVRPRAVGLMVTAVVLMPALVFAQIGGIGSIQGNVLDRYYLGVRSAPKPSGASKPTGALKE